MSTRLLTGILFALAAAAGADESRPYETALYPNGVPARLNAVTGETVRPRFVLHAHAALPPAARELAVYSERFEKDMPLEKLHSTFAAVLEQRGDQWLVLDRRELTGDLPLSLDAPGHVLRLEAMATPLPGISPSVVAVELWASLHGTMGLNAATLLLLTVDESGRLSPALTVKETFASGRVDGNLRSGEMARVLIGTAADARGELLIQRRPFQSSSPGDSAIVRTTCGPPQTTAWRFDGRTFQPAGSVPARAANAYSPLPRFQFLENLSCN